MCSIKFGEIRTLSATFHASVFIAVKVANASCVIIHTYRTAELFLFQPQ